MKSRLTSWLAALLLITAVFGLPVTRVATNRIVCSQVYVEQRKEDRAEQIAAPPAVVHPVFHTAGVQEHFSERLLDHSLFQRPPPSS